jgi:hypothetical protein
MSNKLILFLFLVSYLGLASCGKSSRPTVTFIGDLKEESKTNATNGSYIYSHFLNVDLVRLHNERKLRKTDTMAVLKLYHLLGFKKLVDNAPGVQYRLFAGDSSELAYPTKDSALMVLMGMSVTITDQTGKKVVDVKDLRISSQTGTAHFPYVTDTTNLNGKCISAKEHITSMVTQERNIYYKNIDLYIVNSPAVLIKEQKYKLKFRVFDKVDPNRYFEGETPITAY